MKSDSKGDGTSRTNAGTEIADFCSFLQQIDRIWEEPDDRPKTTINPYCEDRMQFPGWRGGRDLSVHRRQVYGEFA